MTALEYRLAYLDYAASAPLRAEALAVMLPLLERPAANPSSQHGQGRMARAAVETAREQVAALVGAAPAEVVFTSGGTEADNLAVKGIFWARRAAADGRRYRRQRVLVSAIEHHAVLDSARWLADHEGAEFDLLPVDERARVHPAALRDQVAAAPEAVAVISVMWANNEVGTVQPITELAAIARERGVPFHTDAVQAVGQVPVDFAGSGVSAMTITGHKIGGPTSVGALLLARGVDPVPVLHGGGQERDVRSGTLDAPAIAGLAEAVRLSVERRARHAARLTELRGALVREIRRVAPGAVLNGDPDAAVPGRDRLPGNAHFSFPGCEGDALLMLLDAAGIDCSTGSACSAGVAEASHVLRAMGADPAAARGSLRFSLGHTSEPADIKALAAALEPAVERARVTETRR
jgi:cysteine desulfurase